MLIIYRVSSSSIPTKCIDCAMCAPECPWEAIFPDVDVPAPFDDDIALNALATDQPPSFHVPTARLLQHPSAEQVDANRRRWADRGASAKTR